MVVPARLAQLVEQRCQIVVATHSPILLALPGATIYELTDDGPASVVSYDNAMPVRMTRDFLADPQRYLRHLLRQ
jgi:predicted ATPase